MTDTDIPPQVTEDAATGVEDPEAPYGWVTDPVTKELRPRKRPGRRPAAARPPEGRPPNLEELRASGPAREEQAADRAPGRSTLRRGKRRNALQRVTNPKPVEELPPFRAGPLAKQINRLYRRAGRILKAMDRDLGIAVIECTKKEEEDDVTVGEAWEEICRTNPRIRAWWLKLTTTGAWGTLVEAHAPILLALLLKDSIRRRIPFGRLIEAFMEDRDEEGGGQGDDDDQEDGGAGGGLGRLLGDLTPEDMAQMQSMAGMFAAKMAGNVPRSSGASAERTPTVDAPEGGP